MRDSKRVGAGAYSRPDSDTPQAVAKRAGQWRRGPIRRLLRPTLLGVLLAYAALSGLASTASASTTVDLRGEWSLTFNCAECQFVLGEPHTLHGTSVIRQMDASSGNFSGSVLLGGVLPGTIIGDLSASAFSSMVVEVMTPAPYAFTMTSGTVNGGENEISGTGYFGPPGPSGQAGTLTAKKLRSYEAIVKEEQEKKEKAEKEAKERAEKVAKEKAEKEAKELVEKEAKEKETQAKEKAEQEARATQEAKEKTEKEAQAAREAKAKSEAEAKAAQAAQAAKEAKEREEREKSSKGGKVVGQSAGLSGKTFAVSSSGLVSLGLSNPNGYAISGQVTLAMASAGKASHGTAKVKVTILGEGPYALSSHATKTVKLKLAKAALAALERQKTLRVVVKIATRAGGHATIVKTYTVSLKLAPAHKHH